MPDTVYVSMTLLQAHHLSKRYGDFLAVDDVSLSVASGEVVALLGPNGSGKTTIMRAIGSTVRLTSGQVLLDGIDARLEPRRVKKHLGVVHQEDTLDPDLTVEENLLIYSFYLEIPRALAEEKTRLLLERFSLTAWKATAISHLSGGLKRRLMLARAFFNARVLLLDEPTTGLDPEARLALWADIRNLLSTGVAVLLTSHDMEEVARLADRVILLDRGRIRSEGSPAELIRRETSGRVFEVRLPVPRLAEAGDLENSMREVAGDGRVTRHGGFLFCETAREEGLRKWADEKDIPLTVRPANLGDVYLSATGRRLDE